MGRSSTDIVREHPGGATLVDAMTGDMTGDWAATLGKEHGARARLAELTARAADDTAAEIAAQSLERWTHIVGAMTQFVSAYNRAFDRDVLSVAEDRSDPNRPVVTVQAGADAAPSLHAALEGSLICVRSSNAEGVSCEKEYRLRRDRDDEQTAAYVLQCWMERL